MYDWSLPIIYIKSRFGESQSFICFNVSGYCSFWPSSPGNDRLGTELESEGRMTEACFKKIFNPFFRMKGDGVQAK